MKRPFFLFGFILSCLLSQAQKNYDSITISGFMTKADLYIANWEDSLKAGRFPAHIFNERTIWVKPAEISQTIPSILALTTQIKTNGTADVSKCFFPRHAVNYYKDGKIVKYLLICFQCDNLEFSDDPKKTFVKSIDERGKQMEALKEIFKDLL